MNLSGLLGALRQRAAYQALLGDLDHHHGGSIGLIRAARPFVTAALAVDSQRPILVISARIDRAQNLAEQLLAWSPDLRVLTFAEPGAIFYQRAPWGASATRVRLQALAELSSGSSPGTVIIASARGLMHRTLPPSVHAQYTVRLDQGKDIPDGEPSAAARQWAAMGYQAVTVVTEPGTFSHRGGILDVYPVADERPVRIELWGNAIESIRAFDPASQRSLDTRQSVTITPAREAMPHFGPTVAVALKEWFAQSNDSASNPRPNDSTEYEKLAQGQPFPSLEFYLPYMHPETASLLDYLPDHCLTLVDDWEELADTAAELEAQAVSLRETGIASGETPPDMPVPLVTWGQLGDDLAERGAWELAGKADQAAALEGVFSAGPRFSGQIKTALDAIRTASRAGTEISVVASMQASRLAELWNERSQGPRLRPVETINEAPEPGLPVFAQGALAEGWILHGDGASVHLLTDAEIFGWQRPEPRRRPEKRAVAPEDLFADLQPGSIIVHSEYGIGRFEGLEKRALGGAEREFLLVTYAGGDRLYVPIYQADRLSRYIGPDDGEPDLSRLGTAEWSRVKETTRQAVEQVARELLQLYAARELITGHAFSADTPWQHEMEAAFPYIETADQLRALAEVKADMERARPMDRLICGDVGYGKTEVALRAAFKAVMDGKQVAILVPTTVLAQQHYDTFSRRLAAFPVKVEMLSRFRTHSEQEAILDGLASAQVDIVIGTHRLLGQDVAFHDLGLLIIDEEQRFGVTHKERLKQMRTEVDVLTLTATPIPRTLYMSLTGVRDISTIDTAPEERQSITTYVGRRDDDLIRQAILRELDRGGQVFYVHNRVQSIYAEAERLDKLIPEASIAVGHGQMSETTLEAVMSQFASAQIDVLVSTSIIEAGLDIPNANTLIVDRADMFGLAQLHQLRGRVGRSASRAFAYFFHPSTASLTPEALARLETIAEEAELGAGMNIAVRDLELRGTGDILGTRQHGQIAAVGFHLYTRMLTQAVTRLRAERDGSLEGRRVVEENDDAGETAIIDLPMPTHIPTDYVADSALRIQLYRRMADLPDQEAIDKLGAELADRFGPLPEPVSNLLYQLAVRRLAIRARVSAITSDGRQISIRMAGLAHVDRTALQRSIGHNVRVSRTAIWLPRGDGNTVDWKETLPDTLSKLTAWATAVVA